MTFSLKVLFLFFCVFGFVEQFAVGLEDEEDEGYEGNDSL